MGTLIILTREEKHGYRRVGLAREELTLRRKVTADKGVGKLGEKTGAITGYGVGIDSTPVGQVAKAL